MNTSIKKNETKTLAPYKLARIIRDINGTGILSKRVNYAAEIVCREEEG